LRTLISEIVLTVHSSERRVALEICWEGGARTELQLRLGANVFERWQTSRFGMLDISNAAPPPQSSLTQTAKFDTSQARHKFGTSALDIPAHELHFAVSGV
jgi:hypothetical protein